MLQPSRVHLSESDYQRALGDGFGQFEWVYPDLSDSLTEVEAAAADASQWRTSVLRGLSALRFDLLDTYATLEDLDVTGVGWARALRHRLSEILAELQTLFRAVSQPQRDRAALTAWALAVCDRIRTETSEPTVGGWR